MTTRQAHKPGLLHALFACVFDRSASEEAAAAARYWTAIGHDMPIQERAGRLRQLRQHAPIVKAHRPHLGK